MKNMLPCLLLLPILCLAVWECAPQSLPEPPEAALPTEDPAQPGGLGTQTETDSSVLQNAGSRVSAAGIAALQGMLAETEKLESCTAGSTLRVTGLAGRMLDWMGEYAPVPGEAEAAARNFAGPLTAEERELLSASLKRVFAAALNLCGEDPGLLEDCGCAPRFAPWEEEKARSFFGALLNGTDMNIQENP